MIDHILLIIAKMPIIMPISFKNKTQVDVSFHELIDFLRAGSLFA